MCIYTVVRLHIFNKIVHLIKEFSSLSNWTFTVKDDDGKVLAQLDHDWRGFCFEVCVP